MSKKRIKIIRKIFLLKKIGKQFLKDNKRGEYPFFARIFALFFDQLLTGLETEATRTLFQY